VLLGNTVIRLLQQLINKIITIIGRSTTLCCQKSDSFVTQHAYSRFQDDLCSSLRHLGCILVFHCSQWTHEKRDIVPDSKQPDIVCCRQRPPASTCFDVRARIIQ